MTEIDNDVARQIRAEIDQETRKSRNRDRISRERIHPMRFDISRLVHFVIYRRQRQPLALDAARRVIKRVDTTAVRLLVEIVLEGGRYDLATHRRCDRVLGYCDTIEAALALRDELKGRTN